MQLQANNNPVDVSERRIKVSGFKLNEFPILDVA